MEPDQIAFAYGTRLDEESQEHHFVISFSAEQLEQFKQGQEFVIPIRTLNAYIANATALVIGGPGTLVDQVMGSAAQVN